MITFFLKKKKKVETLIVLSKNINLLLLCAFLFNNPVQLLKLATPTTARIIPNLQSHISKHLHSFVPFHIM